MYFVPDGTEKCGFYECKDCGNRFLDIRIEPKLICPYCGEVPDMEVGPDDELPVAKESAILLEVIEGKEEVAQTFEEEEEPATVYEILPPLPNNRKIDSLKNKEKVVVIDGEEADYAEKPSEVTPISKTEEKAVTISEPVEEEKAQPAEAEVAKTEEEAPVEEKAELDEIAQTENLLPPEVEEEPCVALEEEGAKTSEIVEADAFQPIVLVPAEPNPPVAEEKEINLIL